MATVEEAVAGDVDALASIIDRYQGDMARVCVVICGGDAEAAADAVQSAWPIVWRKLSTLHDRERLRPWLVSVAANQARQLLRRERRRKVVEISVANTYGSGADRDAAGLADLSLVLRRLEPDDRTLLALRYVADLDSKQIGEALGMSASGARSRLERLLTRLRTELHDG